MILEIGPGTGNLTNLLIQTGSKVVCMALQSHSLDLLREGHTNDTPSTKPFF